MIDTAVNRLRFTASLAPGLGSTFQPTGFPDIGAAHFEGYDKDGQLRPTLLVESVQSMANRLEATAWDSGAQEPVSLVASMPHVRVCHRDTPEDFLTSSRLEAHRLASAFVREAQLDGKDMLTVITERLGLAVNTPLNYTRMARALLQLDPFCLIHGVFFNHKAWLGQPRFSRAVSAVIEAYDVKQVASGGRKADHVVRHEAGEEDTTGGASEGYGSVPFQRVDWTAREISAKFSVDVELLRSYGLGQEMTELLTALALWEIRSFLSAGLRLRTACDLDLVDEPAHLPTQDELTSRVQELTSSQAAAFGDGGPLTVLWDGKSDKSRKKK